MSEIGYRYNVREDELNELIENADLENPVAILEKLFCLEGEEPAFFDYLSNLDKIVSDWDKGRIFDQNSEIRWERTGDDFHVLWITHNENITGDWEKESLTFKSKKRKILLWGKRIDNENEWYEKQIPKILKYPAKGNGQRAYLEVLEYTMSNNSSVYRFKELIAE